MNRWAHSYVLGAASGTAVIVAALVAFMLLVSFQAFQEWPVSGIGLGSSSGDGGAGSAPDSKRPPPAATTREAVPSAALDARQGVATRAGSTTASTRHRQAGVGVGNATNGGGGDVGSGVQSDSRRGAASPISEPPSGADSAPPTESTGPASAPQPARQSQRGGSASGHAAANKVTSSSGSGSTSESSDSPSRSGTRSTRSASSTDTDGIPVPVAPDSGDSSGDPPHGSSATTRGFTDAEAEDFQSDSPGAGHDGR